MSSDVGSERAVLAGLCKYGGDLYLDICDMVKTDTFTVNSNQMIFKCLDKLCKADDSAAIDLPSILTAAKELGIDTHINKPEELRHLKSILSLHVERANVRKFAAKIRNLQVARLIADQAKVVQEKMATMDGTEKVSSIIAQAEEIIFDFTSLLDTNDTHPKKMGDSLREYVQHLADNPVKQMGIPTGLEEWDKQIGGGLRDATLNVIGARPKMGKMQPYSSIVYTINGPCAMGNLNVGDLVSTPDGGYAKILDIIENGLRDVYKITFSDGSYTECGLEHLWYVKHRRKEAYEVKSLQDILLYGNLLESDGRAKWQIPITKPVYMARRDVKLDPYIMGLLLGDGSFCNTVSFTNIDTELIEALRANLPDGYLLRKDGITYFPTHGVKKLKNHYKEIMRFYGLYGKDSHEKFIPTDYVFNSVYNRIAILQGLLDTDGSIDKNGNVEYCTVSSRLASDVRSIAESLGYLVSTTERTVNGFHSFRLNIKSNDTIDLFRLTRKKIDRRKIRSKPDLKRGIISVEYVGKKQCRCIYIDSPDHLYLTDKFIITHNTVITDNIGFYVAENSQIPVLNLDTEMTYEDHVHRSLAMISGVEINAIETGQFGGNADKKSKVDAAVDRLEKAPYFHKSIAGMPFEDQLALMRRWIQKEVGLQLDGRAKKCVIIYDYLKLMDANGISDAMREFQALGFMMTTLHNFAVRYKIPFIVLIQLNRDGIDGEGTGAASGSDRIIWLCSNFTIFKPTSDEEIAQYGPQVGNRKMVVVAARHGEGLTDPTDFINCHFHGWCARIKEHGIASKLQGGNGGGEDGVDIADANARIPFG